MDKTTIQDEVERALETLAFFLRSSGRSRQDLDRRIGQGRGFTSQVLTGRVKLRYDHVIQILQGINAEPALYFALLHPIAEADRPALHKLQEMFARFQEEQPATQAEPETQGGKVDPEELKRLVQEQVEQALKARQRKRRRA